MFEPGLNYAHEAVKNRKVGEKKKNRKIKPQWYMQVGGWIQNM